MMLRLQVGMEVLLEQSLDLHRITIPLHLLLVHHLPVMGTLDINLNHLMCRT